MLEARSTCSNLRFATGEKDNDDAFAMAIAELSDGWYVNDAFNVATAAASIVGVLRFCRNRLAGQVVAELSVTAPCSTSPERPFVAVFRGTSQATTSAPSSA